MPNYAKLVQDITTSLTLVGGTSTWLRCDASGGTITITGATAPVDGDQILISNVGASGVVVDPAGVSHAVGSSVELRYDAAAAAYEYTYGEGVGQALFTADTVAHTPVEIDGFSTAQTGSLLKVKQVTSGNTLFEIATVTTAATGLKGTSAAAAAGYALVVTSTGTDEALTINAKGAGTITLNGTATGAVVVGSNLNMTEAKNVVLGTTTGTKIGTATNQKLGFFNSTPIVQPSITGALSTVADAPAKAVLTSIIAALKATGLGLAADSTT